METIAVAILFENGKVLIAKRKYGRKLAGFWEFPGGQVNDGENAKECIKRLLEEKLGIRVKVGKFFGSSFYDYEYGPVKLLGYWATLAGGEINPAVHDEVVWAAPEELNRYIITPADIPFVKKLMSGQFDISLV